MTASEVRGVDLFQDRKSPLGAPLIDVLHVATLRKETPCMASLPTTTSELTRTPTKLFGGPIFDIVYGVTVSWFLGGAFLDSWAHENIPRLETFWTPWHGV